MPDRITYASTFVTFDNAQTISSYTLPGLSLLIHARTKVNFMWEKGTPVICKIEFHNLTACLRADSLNFKLYYVKQRVTKESFG